MRQLSVRKFVRPLLSAAAVAAIAGLIHVPAATAQTQTTSPYTYDEAVVLRGLQISPVPLNTEGRDRNQVGYGSYIVNAMAGCNDCHTNPNYQPDGDPFRGMPKKVNVAGFMGGGIAFGPFTSRNITPSAEGPTTGNLANFKTVFRTGVDLRKLHPEISPMLQVMPWPMYQDMTDKDIEAVFAYLSSIPCVEGGLGEKENRCGRPAAATTAVAAPKDTTTVSPQVNLDASKSVSANGEPLTYSWRVADGSPTAAILRANSATPTIQFSIGPAVYRFELTVTDSTGKTATDTVTINFARSL